MFTEKAGVHEFLDQVGVPADQGIRAESGVCLFTNDGEDLLGAIHALEVSWKEGEGVQVRRLLLSEGRAAPEESWSVTLHERNGSLLLGSVGDRAFPALIQLGGVPDPDHEILETVTAQVIADIRSFGGVPFVRTYEPDLGVPGTSAPRSVRF